MISRVIRRRGLALLCGAWLALTPRVVKAEDARPVDAPAIAVPAVSSPQADSASVRFPEARVRHWQVGLLRPDRMQHASLSLTIGLAAGLLSRKAATAAWGSMACGLAKEVHDIGGSGFDPIDLCADALGAGAAALGTHYLEN